MQSSHSDLPENASPAPVSRIAGEAALLFSCALFAGLLGILTRPHGGLALFWPANALILGLFLRKPRMAEMHGWLSATAGLVCADLVAGNSELATLWLTSANMLGIATGYLLFQMLPPAYRDLTRPQGIFRLLLIAVCAALAGATTGAGAAPFIIGQPSLAGFGLWFSNELLNFIVILPAMLTAPSLSRWPVLMRQLSSFAANTSASRYLRPAIPFLTLCLSIIASLLADHPLAMTLLPLPALLWCAVRYPVCLASLLLVMICLWLTTCAWNVPLAPSIQLQLQPAQIFLARLLVVLVLFLPLLVSAHAEQRRKEKHWQTE